MLLEAKGICQKFADSEILKNIDLDVEHGEVYVVIGPTGSGKTTLLRIIGLLDRPSSGTLQFDGSAVPEAAKGKLAVRRRMAVVFQRPVVFNANVYDNIAYSLKIRREKKHSIRDKVTKALETVGLSGYEKRQARTLSGGETQRVALARAMVIEPELLLLDEPTANLDPVSTTNVERTITEIIKSLKTTVIMSTHDMLQGQRLADRMGVIVAGELLQTGTPKEIFSAPQNRRIAELVGMQNILAGRITSSDREVVDVKINGTAIQAISDLTPGTEVYACIRPDEIILAQQHEKTSARNVFAATITAIVPADPLVHIHIDCGFPLVALITVKSTQEMGLQVGGTIYASFKATRVHVIAR